MYRRDVGPSRGRMWLGAAIALALLAAAVISIVASVRLDALITQADGLGDRLDVARTTLDAEVGAFVSVSSVHDQSADLSADLTAVYESVDTLTSVRTILDVARSDVEELEMPKVAPQGPVRDVRGALIARADALGEYDGTMLASAEFAVDRTEAFKAVANTLDTLQQLADEGVTIEQAEQLVRDVRAQYDASLERMRAGESAAPVLYSNTQVVQRLEEISVALAEIEAAIVARDQGRIDAAFQSYVALVETDWLARLTLNNSAGLQVIEAAKLADDDSAEAYREARKDVDKVRQAFFLGGLVMLIAALVMGARAVLLRESPPER